MNAFKLLLRIQGFPIRRALQVYEDLTQLSAAGLAEHQETKKWAIVKHHRQHNPFYSGFDQLQNRWHDIAPMSKSDIQRPLAEIINPEFIHRSVYRNNTSGSTGIPFHFVKDKFCHAMTWACIFKKYESVGLRYGESLQARFFGIPLSRKKYITEKLKDYSAARVRFPVFDLSDARLAFYLKQFHHSPFVFIYGYTSSLVLFARHLLAQNVILAKICPTLTRCVVTSEVCTDEDRTLLEAAFGVRVVNEYGAAELDLIAFEDMDGDWVLNEENLFIEVLDDQGQPVQPGTEGEVVVTSLYNRAMPFIRYRLGDRMVLKDRLKNGRRIIDSMKGRVNDVAILPSGRKSPGLTFYYVSKSFLETSGTIREFIIKQVKANEFVFEYVASTPLTASQKLQVQRLMDQYLEPGLQAVFVHVSKIERTAAGKFRHFQYLVPEHIK